MKLKWEIKMFEWVADLDVLGLKQKRLQANFLDAVKKNDPTKINEVLGQGLKKLT